MKRVFPNCAGLDVHKRFIVACRLWVDQHGQAHQAIRKFGTMTADLEALAAWLAEVGCTDVVLESTGIYWRPILNILDGRFTLWVVNAKHVKHVPGRKTDVKDAEWLAQLLQQGLLRPSFLPPRAQRELRELVRHRQSLVDDRTRIANRVQKVLEDANLKLAAVVGDIQGVSAQAILHALLAGEQDPQVLADLARGKLRQKRAQLEQALVGRLQEYHRFLLTHLLSHLDFLDEEIGAVEAQLEALVARVPELAETVERLDTIPGVSWCVAVLIVAEVGLNLERFPTDRHLTAWAGLAPGNNETGGKQRPTTTRKGNRYLRRGLVQAAHGAARTRDSYFKALYHRIARRRGKQRAAVAVARSILQVAYHMMRRKETYRELGADYFDQLDRERTTKRLVRRLERLGYSVKLSAGQEGPMPESRAPSQGFAQAHTLAFS